MQTEGTDSKCAPACCEDSVRYTWFSMSK